MTSQDWRDAPARDILPLLARDAAEHRERLSWDPAASLAILEEARRARLVPGVVVRDDAGRPRGWGYFVVDGDFCRVGGISGDDEEATDRVMAELLDRAREAGARHVSGLFGAGAPGLEHALAARGVASEPYLYLGRTLDRASDGAAVAGVRRFRADHVPAAAAILHQAHDGRAGSRVYAPTGATHEWRTYVEQLIAFPGCGTFLPDSSFVAGADAGAPDGVVIATRIAPRTAHIAQLAVSPRAQRKGIGSRLLAAASTAAAADHDAITLLVAAGNAAALALYRARGFAERSRFISIWK